MLIKVTQTKARRGTGDSVRTDWGASLVCYVFLNVTFCILWLTSGRIKGKITLYHLLFLMKLSHS